MVALTRNHLRLSERTIELYREISNSPSKVLDMNAGVTGAAHAGTEIIHVSIAVKDVYEAAEEIQRLTGIGPFEFLEPNYTDMTFQGKPGNFKMRFGFAQAGPIRLELSQRLSGDTIYEEYVKRKGYGLHHIGIKTDNIERSVKEMEAKGIRVTQSGVRPGNKWAYLDTEEQTGVVFELVERK